MSTTYFLANSLSIETAAVLADDLVASLEQSLILAQNQLLQFANGADFSQQLAIAFGSSVDGLAFQSNWRSGDYSILSQIEVRSGAELGGAKGAYGSKTDRIYLSQDFLLANQNNPEALAAVLLEEAGHRLDARLNVVDSIGDEGAIFSRLVQSGGISNNEFQAFQSRDDHAILTLDGQSISVEQASDPLSQAQIDQLKDGFNQVFTTLNNNVGAKIFAEQFPLLGNNIKDAFDTGIEALQYLRTLRDTINKGLDTLKGSPTYTTAQVQSAINTALTSVGITGIGSVVTALGNDVKLDFDVQDSFAPIQIGLESDFGLPFLGFKTTGNANAKLDYNFKFDVGLDNTGFYFDTSPIGSQFQVKLGATIPNFSAQADLSLLRFTATDNISKPTAFDANFSVAFKDPNNDNKLRISELTSPDLLNATLNADANISLKLQSALSTAIPLPKFSTNLNVGWKFNASTIDSTDNNKTFGDVPKISFADTSLDLGSFFDSAAGKFLGEINKVTAPIAPIIKVLTTPIPMLSKLGSKKVTILNLLSVPQDQRV
jgi:hypothetical protein